LGTGYLDRDGRKIKPISLAGFNVVYLVKKRAVVEIAYVSFLI
jgi:hypothetical protein